MRPLIIAGLLAALAAAVARWRPPTVRRRSPRHQRSRRSGPGPRRRRPTRCDRGDWWTFFGDAQLNDLEGRIEASNPTLAEALARYDQARAFAAEASAGDLPRIGFGTSVTANRQSEARPLRGSDQPDFYGANTIGGEVDYELDLWGRMRNLRRRRQGRGPGQRRRCRIGAPEPAGRTGRRLCQPARPRRRGAAAQRHRPGLCPRPGPDRGAAQRRHRLGPRRRPRPDPARDRTGPGIRHRRPAGAL